MPTKTQLAAFAGTFSFSQQQFGCTHIGVNRVDDVVACWAHLGWNP
jgi:hypothetical protein